MVVCREAPRPLWTHPSTVFPQSQAPPLGKVCDEQSETGCSPSRWAGAPGSEQLVGGPSEKCRPCSAPRRPHLSSARRIIGPQELPAGSVDTSLASCLATDHQFPHTHTSSPPPHELGAQGRTHTAPHP